MADSKPRPSLAGSPAGRRTFSTAFRGFDQEEVRAYLEDLAKEFHELRDRITQLESELEAARSGSQPPPPVPAERPKVDVVAITNALGEETARVLRTAQEAADDLRERAEEGAAKALSEAHEEAARVRGEAEALLARRTAEAEEAAARLRADAEDAAAAMRAEAKDEADRTIAEAIEQGRDMLSQAQAARERVLADLGRRRKVGLAQIERLRGGREQLSTTLTSARADIDRMIAALAEADEEARRLEEAIAPHVAKEAEAEDAATEAPPGAPEGTAERAEPAGAAPAPSAAPAAVTEEVGAAVAGAAAPVAHDTGTPAAHDAGPSAAPGAAAATGGGAAASVAERVAPSDAVVGTSPAATNGTGTPAATDGRELPGDDAGAGGGGATAGSPRAREPYKHDRVPAAVLPEEAVGGAEERPKVDDLFARIRAERAGKEPEAASEPEAEEESAPAREDHALEAPRSDEDESILQRRDAMLDAPLASTLRAVKRGLADEQNMALERLRKTRTPTLDALLDDEDTHKARASRWAAAGLAACARAGSSLAGKPDAVLPEEALAPAVARVAEELVMPVRQRAATVIDEGGADMADRFNSMYREARARIERVIGDAVTETVSSAVIAASEDGTSLRWVVDDPEGPCPDCDDNALAGAVPVGQPFPTGQVAPPAHPGCRCVLAPAPA